jgi:hypothetical protein
MLVNVILQNKLTKQKQSGKLPSQKPTKKASKKLGNKTEIK